MQSMSVTKLKTHTGEVLLRVGRGEAVLITKRGKPCAVLSPVSEEEIPMNAISPELHVLCPGMLGTLRDAFLCLS